MAATQLTRDYGALLTTTADKIHKSGAIQNTISQSNPVFKAFHDGSRIKKIEMGGGDQIRAGLMTGLNGTFKWYSDYDEFDMSPQEGITTAFFPWAQAGGVVSISGIQKFKNAGAEKIVGLLTEKLAQNTATWSEKCNMALLDAAGRQTTAHPYTAFDGKQMIGIPLYVQAFANADTDDFDIGHVDQSAETGWKNKEVVSAATTFDGLEDEMRKAHQIASFGPDGTPDKIISDPVSFRIYERGLNVKMRYSQNDKATAGFETIRFKNCDMQYDVYVPDMYTTLTPNGSASTTLTYGTMFFLNTKTFTLYMGKGADWSPLGFQRSYNQDAYASPYIAYIQLVNHNRRKNAVLHKISPAIVA